MKRIKHKEFISGNKLDNASFSEAVQKKISIFDKMHSMLDDVVDDDKTELLEQLKELDHELHEDMLDELEERLENNDEIEEEETGFPLEKKDSLKTLEEFKIEHHKEKKKPSSQPSPKPASAPPVKPAPVKDSNLELIEKLWNKGQRKIGRSALIAMGFKGKPGRKEIKIGQYRLNKAFFSFTYYITLENQ